MVNRGTPLFLLSAYIASWWSMSRGSLVSHKSLYLASKNDYLAPGAYCEIRPRNHGATPLGIVVPYCSQYGEAQYRGKGRIRLKVELRRKPGTVLAFRRKRKSTERVPQKFALSTNNGARRRRNCHLNDLPPWNDE